MCCGGGCACECACVCAYTCSLILADRAHVDGFVTVGSG